MPSLFAESETGDEVENSSRFWGDGTAVSHFYRARGSKAIPKSPLKDDILGGIGSRPWAGGDWSDHSTAAIHWIAGENIGLDNQGTWLNFLTTPNGLDYTGRKINMRLSPSGYLYYKVGTAKVYKSSAPQTLTNATYTAVSFDAEAWDNRDMHSSNSTRLYAQQDGKYHVSATIPFASSANGARIINFRVNGNPDDRYGYQSTPALNSLQTIISSSDDIDLEEGDYVEVYAYQNSGGNLSIPNETSQPGTCRFSMRYTGD